jgi:hypothetical protein
VRNSGTDQLADTGQRNKPGHEHQTDQVNTTEEDVFKVPPRRWVSERTLAWIARHWHRAKDYEQLPEIHQAMVF